MSNENRGDEYREDLGSERPEDPHSWARGNEGLLDSSYLSGKPLGEGLAKKINEMNRARFGEGNYLEIRGDNIRAYFTEERQDLLARKNERERAIEEKKKNKKPRKTRTPKTTSSPQGGR